MKLVEHFEERKKVLQNQLRAAKSKDEVISAINNELETLRSREGEYLSELTDSQERIAKDGLRLLASSFDLLKAVTEESIPSQGVSEYTQGDTHDDLKNAILAAIGGVIGSPAGVVGSILGASFITGMVPQIIRILDLDSTTKKPGPATYRMPTNETQLSVEVDKVLSYLGQAFESIDHRVAIYGSKPKEVKHKATLEELSDVLEFFQELYAEALLDEKDELPPGTHAQLKQLPTILTHYEIKVKLYPKEGPKPVTEEWQLFDFEPSLDPTIEEYVTIQPALIKNGEVLRRGRVIEPASSAHS